MIGGDAEKYILTERRALVRALNLPRTLPTPPQLTDLKAIEAALKPHLESLKAQQPCVVRRVALANYWNAPWGRVQVPFSQVPHSFTVTKLGAVYLHWKSSFFAAGADKYVKAAIPLFRDTYSYVVRAVVTSKKELWGERIVQACPRHGNVAEILDIVEYSSKTGKDKASVLMPLYPKGNLGRHMGVPGAVASAWQAARGLVHLEKNGVLHYDVKPANLLVDRDNTVKVSDFGRVWSSMEMRCWLEDPEFDRWKFADLLKATPYYAEPVNPQAWEGSADEVLENLFKRPVYALGVSMVLWLSKRRENELPQLVQELQTSQPEPGSLREFVKSMVDPNPRNRPTMEQVEEQMRQFHKISNTLTW